MSFIFGKTLRSLCSFLVVVSSLKLSSFSLHHRISFIPSCVDSFDLLCCAVTFPSFRWLLSPRLSVHPSSSADIFLHRPSLSVSASIRGKWKKWHQLFGKRRGMERQKETGDKTRDGKMKRKGQKSDGGNDCKEPKRGKQRRDVRRVTTGRVNKRQIRKERGR